MELTLWVFGGHCNEVLTLRRLAALAAILAISVGNAALCAGWEAAPEVRMACCAADAVCPMHQPDSHHHGSIGGVTQAQAQADSCCAASGRTESASATSVFVLSDTITATPVPHPAVLTGITPSARRWHALVPLLRWPMPEYVRPSILLV
jgi:hypothetical protein